MNADIIGADLRRADPKRRGVEVTADRIVSARLRDQAAEREELLL